MYWINEQGVAYAGDQQGRFINDVWTWDPVAPDRPDETMWDAPSQTWKPIQAPLPYQMRSLFKQLPVDSRIKFASIEGLVFSELLQDPPDLVAIKAYVNSVPTANLTPQEASVRDQMLALIPGG